MTSGDAIACTYCGHTDPVHVHGKFSWTEQRAKLEYSVYHCSVCGLYFSGPLDEAALISIEDHFGASYNNTRQEDFDATIRRYWSLSLYQRLRRGLTYLRHRSHRWLGISNASRYAQILDAVLDGNPKTVLDVGCSFGLFLSLCRTAGLQAYGIEPSGEVVTAIVSVRNNAGVERGFFPQCHGSFVTYDRIVLNSTLIAFPHVTREFFAACKALLNPGGRLIIYDIDPDSTDPGVAIAFAAPVWLSFPSVKFMERVAADLGFSGYETEPARLEADKRLHVLKL